ncbi:MAG: hypothetical protein ACP5OJ_01395 [Methanothermobacter sp.]
MSLGIVIKGPEGLVLAAESRITLTADEAGNKIPVSFDNATKLISFSEPNSSVGVVSYGLAAIGLRTPHSFLPEFESQLSDERLKIKEFTQKLSDFYMEQWKNSEMPRDYSGPPMSFVVAGFDEGEPYGKVFLFEIPYQPVPEQRNPGENEFGITWGGQREIVDRLIMGLDPNLAEYLNKKNMIKPELKGLLTSLQMQIPLAAMPLQDCVDLAIFFIRTTITAQHLTVGIRGCGGPIDVATITRREGLKFVQKKHITGEK